MSTLQRMVVYVGLVAVSSSVSAQQSLPAFAEYRGTWALDESASDIRFRMVRTLVITTTPTEITVTKDSDSPEVYRIDGTETKTRDLRADGAPNEHRYSLLVIANMLELTSKTRRDDGKPTFTHTVTDAYRVSGDTLTVGRQRDFITLDRERVEPPGNLTAFAAPAKYIQTLVYRRRSG